MKNAFKIGLALGFGALLLQGCDIYGKDLLTYTGKQGPADEGDGKWWHTTVDCPEDESGNALQCGPTGNECASEGIPKAEDRPAESDPGAELKPFYFGITRLRVGNVADTLDVEVDPDAWRTIGFDIDGTCTRSRTCTLTADDTPIGEASCATNVVSPADGDNCRDNTVGQLFQIAATQDSLRMFGFNEPRWNCALRTGGLNIISKVSNYNGKANDESVRIDLYSSVGTTDSERFNCGEAADYGTKADWWLEAEWTQTTPWEVARRSIDPTLSEAELEAFDKDLPDAVVADANAYVRNGWVVARLPQDSEIWLNDENATYAAGMRLIIQRGTFAAKLEKDPLLDTWVVSEGTIAGAVKGTDALESFHELGFCDNFCGNHTLFQNYLTTYGDLSSKLGAANPDEPCDSMSLAIAFKGKEAKAIRDDIVDVKPPVKCPVAKHPDAPPHGCVCPEAGSGETECLLPETGGAGGSGAGGSGAGGSGAGGSGGV